MDIRNFDINRIAKGLRERGVTQKQIADALDIPQSAVSNLLNGKRRLLVGEAIALLNFFDIDGKVQDGISFRRVPLVSLENAADWESSSIEQIPSTFMNLPADTNVVLADGYDERITVERFRNFRVTFEPGVFDLEPNVAYILRTDDGVELATYRDSPARFENFWDPTWNGGPRRIGSFGFRIVGRIISVATDVNYNRRIS